MIPPLGFHDYIPGSITCKNVEWYKLFHDYRYIEVEYETIISYDDTNHGEAFNRTRWPSVNTGAK